jgi:gluconolactonase
MLELDMTVPGLSRLVSANAPLDCIHHGLLFGEGPLWNRRDATFLWVDIVGDTIFRWRPGVGAEVLIRPSTKAKQPVRDDRGRRAAPSAGLRPPGTSATDREITPVPSASRAPMI